MINHCNETVAIVVTYNRLTLFKECIEALSDSSVNCDVLIVNNNSSDGTSEYLVSLIDKPNVKYHIYNLNTNLNGAGGYSYGLNEACKLNYKYVWLMDDDCIVKKDSLLELYKVKDELKDNFGFLSSKVLWTDNSICKTNIQRRSVARKIKEFNSHIYRVDFSSFVSCFVKTEDVRKVGLPIKDFVIWTDDLEWTRRLTYKKINDNAKDGYICNDSEVIHKCKENYGVTIVKDSNDRIDRYKYIYRNDVYCFKREGIRGNIYLLIRNLYHILCILVFSKGNKINKIKILINGYIEGYKFNPLIEYVH